MLARINTKVLDLQFVTSRDRSQMISTGTSCLNAACYLRKSKKLNSQQDSKCPIKECISVKHTLMGLQKSHQGLCLGMNTP